MQGDQFAKVSDVLRSLLDVPVSVIIYRIDLKPPTNHLKSEKTTTSTGTSRWRISIISCVSAVHITQWFLIFRLHFKHLVSHHPKCFVGYLHRIISLIIALEKTLISSYIELQVIQDAERRLLLLSLGIGKDDSFWRHRRAWRHGKAI